MRLHPLAGGRRLESRDASNALARDRDDASSGAKAQCSRRFAHHAARPAGLISCSKIVAADRRRDVRAGWLDAKEGRFGKSQISHSGRIGSEIVFWPIAEILPDQSGNRAVRIEYDQRSQPAREMQSDRPCKPHEIIDVAAVDELRTRHHLDRTRPKHERICAPMRLAPKAYAPVIRVLQKQVALVRVKGRVRLGPGIDDKRRCAAGPRAREQG